MKYLNFCSAVVFLLAVISIPQLASAQCGAPANCSIPPHITVCPTGDIPTTCIIRDINNNPCPGSTLTMTFNANCLCGSATIVTAVTNINGVARFFPAWGGCCNAPGLVTYTDASGVVLGASMAANSPDLNGDCIVNLTDISLFSNAFFGVYSPCADFNADGVINLTDIGVMAQHMGH